MPELPSAKLTRFVSHFGVTPYDAGVLSATRTLANYFEATVAAAQVTAQAVAPWITGEFLRHGRG